MPCGLGTTIVPIPILRPSENKIAGASHDHRLPCPRVDSARSERCAHIVSIPVAIRPLDSTVFFPRFYIRVVFAYGFCVSFNQ